MSTTARPPTQPRSFSEIKSAHNGKDTAFRFKAHQRAFLEAEVAKNGAFPDFDRREELAEKLGVVEKSVRVRDLKAL